jgi:hypothetical protein
MLVQAVEHAWHIIKARRLSCAAANPGLAWISGLASWIKGLLHEPSSIKPKIKIAASHRAAPAF